MADHRRGYVSNSPDGPEDRDRDRRSSAGSELRSWLGFASDDPPGQYGRGVQSWGQANEGGNWGSGHRQTERGHYGPEHGYGGFQGDYGGGDGQGGFGGRGDWQGGRQSFSGSPRFGPQDQPYLDWRERQIAELDRDYEDYCRERGKDFHSSFDSWRRSRSSGGSEAGGTTSGTLDSTGSTEPRNAQTARSKR